MIKNLLRIIFQKQSIPNSFPINFLSMWLESGTLKISYQIKVKLSFVHSGICFIKKKNLSDCFIP